MDAELEEIRERFVEAAGNITQSLGAGRVLGHIFAQIYFSRDPQSLDDLTRELGISKGSASMAVRQLEHWGALRRIWIKGDRKDYYESQDEFGRVVRRALRETIVQKMEVADSLLNEAEVLLKEKKKGRGKLGDDWKFVDGKLRRLRSFRDRAQWMWDHFVLKLLSK
jgi:DNA-binding transcriptional regulator GbsR (MarR family)